MWFYGPFMCATTTYIGLVVSKVPVEIGGFEFGKVEVASSCKQMFQGFGMPLLLAANMFDD